MTKKTDKQDNEVYILGSENNNQNSQLSKRFKGFIILACFIVIGIIVFFIFRPREDQATDYYFEPEQLESQSAPVSLSDTTTNKITTKGYIEVTNDTINDVPLSIYVPHNADMLLQTGMPDKNDSTIIFTAMAADIRKDNNQIVGDFVLAGKTLARGIAKKGYCAIIDDVITIGMGDETSLLQEAIDKQGYFFRQYPLVLDGQVIENKPKNKSIRRAIAIRNNEIIMVQSQNNESFHDFSQALLNVGVTSAIYLVGGNAYGWYYDSNHVRIEHGKEDSNLPETITYIVWKVKP